MILIASIGENNELGREGDLCWHIREDLKHFKSLTMGSPVIMGRKTWESLPKKPLPGRLNIVVTSGKLKPEEVKAGVFAVRTLPDAVRVAEKVGMTPYIIGGASVYAEAMPEADRLEITRIYAADPEADVFFPEIKETEWMLETASDTMTTPDGLRYRYESYTRRQNK